jgi:8-oxo-dGTP diphosphatase
MTAVLKCVLVFIIRDGEVLLIRKKRGLGAGKVNGPGGKIDPGETALQAAVRETQEEVGLTPMDLTEAGEVYFTFTNGQRIHCLIYRAENCTGDMTETAEALPFWCPVDNVPFDQMWQDDQYWFAHLISRTRFEGMFDFDDDTLLWKVVRTV